MEKILSDYGISRTVDGEWWLCKSENNTTYMFKQYASYEEITIAIQTEDLDKLWEEYNQAQRLKLHD